MQLSHIRLPRLHRLAFACLLFLSISLLPERSFAWGWDGHRFVCAMAEQQLTPKAKAMVNQYLQEAADLKGGVTDFAESCLWADDVKYSTRQDTYEHHFINVPDDANQIVLTRDCQAINCLAVGLQRALVYLTREPDGSRSVTRRAAALRYLGHYVGDLHQPLHIGNASDWGGNKISIRWDFDEDRNKKTNLHAIWDYKMPEAMGLKYPDSLPFLMSIEVDAGTGTPLDWMNESLAFGRSHAYVNSKGRPIRDGDRLGKRYLDHNKPIVLERLALAAKRLAALLNEIAEGGQPTAFSITSD